MKSYVTALLALLPVGVAVFVGCAEGAPIDPTVGLLMTVPVEAGAGGDEQSITIPKAPPKGIEEGDAGGGGGKDAGGVGAGDGGGGVDAGGGVVGVGGPLSCDTAVTCSGNGAGATDLGYMTGDQNADVVTKQGSTSLWMKVTLGEDSWSAAPLRLKATLTSPAGSNFDLFIHSKTCATPTVESTSTTAADTAKISIPDSCDGCPDDQLVLIEVRHVSGPCDSSAKWTLKLEGNK